jgi:hypothetical protein
VILTGLAAGCTSPIAVDDPQAAREVLASPGGSGRKHLGAMQTLDAQPDKEEYFKQLLAIMYRPGYTIEVREAALTRLAAYDLDALKRTIRQRLPRMGARGWHDRLCILIAERGWVDLTPALVSSWAQRVGFVDDLDRMEYTALVRLYGPDHVIDAVFEILVESSKPYQLGLRSRCWELLHRLGERERLEALLAQPPPDTTDLMMVDLHRASVELGVVPRTREEILWIRMLMQGEHAEFWSQAVAAVHDLPDTRRREMELRDLPILVAAAIHDPWLLNADKAEMYDRVAARISSSRVHVDPRRFEGFPGIYPQRLFEHRKKLTWGDLAAMYLAVQAADVSEVAAHLFDYALRDHEDTSCEYGGVIVLDEEGRFEILEFPPRYRRRDNEFIASQAMMNASYTAVFHFHLHVQRYRNERYATPGMGDLNYADSTRANCLVFTFVGADTLNMDFYRHGRVIVDLGEIHRP